MVKILFGFKKILNSTCHFPGAGYYILIAGQFRPANNGEMKMLHTFTNAEYGIESRVVVYTGKNGGFIVSLYDTDANEALNHYTVFQNVDDAIAYAKSLVA